jgi:hypothetical protein
LFRNYGLNHKEIKRIFFLLQLCVIIYMDMSTSCVVCGTKSQDYAIECYCCGNYYCSDKCKVQDHQKKLFHRHTWMDYRKIFEGIMSIDPNIRFVTIFDINGKIKYSDHRQGTENLLTPEESKKSLKLALNAWKIRGELAPKIGKGKYVLAEYENIKRITMPLGDNHLIYVTTEVDADHSTIISGIKDIARQNQNF